MPRRGVEDPLAGARGRSRNGAAVPERGGVGSRLDHDNIARVYHVGQDRGLHYIVFEFIEGVNVRKLVETKGPLSLAEAVSYTLQVADALAHASERNVVHRDIKPSNLLITPTGQAKLIDMGLARLLEVDPAVADLTASGVTWGPSTIFRPSRPVTRGTPMSAATFIRWAAPFSSCSPAGRRSWAARCCRSCCSISPTRLPTCISFALSCRRTWTASCARCWPRIPATVIPRRWSWSTICFWWRVRRACVLCRAGGPGRFPPCRWFQPTIGICRGSFPCWPWWRSSQCWSIFGPTCPGLPVHRTGPPRSKRTRGPRPELPGAPPTAIPLVPAPVAAEKSGGEKALIPGAKPSGDALHSAAPKESGEKKPALKAGQTGNSLLPPAGRWTSGSAQTPS